MKGFDEIWKEILKYEGEVFKTIRGDKFKYKIEGDNIFFSNAIKFKHTKKNIIKAYELGKVGGPSELNKNGVTGSSYVYSILNDVRIKNVK